VHPKLLWSDSYFLVPSNHTEQQIFTQGTIHHIHKSSPSSHEQIGSPKSHMYAVLELYIHQQIIGSPKSYKIQTYEILNMKE
jgi:hypothetical protein